MKLSVVLSILLSISFARADEPRRKLTALEILPADACGAVAIRNMKDLAKKGDVFLKESELQVPMRPSQLFEMLLAQLGISKGVDHDAAGSVMILRYANPENWVVTVVPFDDLDAMAGNFGLTAKDLPEGKTVRSKAADIQPWNRLLRVHRNCLLVGGSDEALKQVVQGKTALSQLDEETKKLMSACDLVGLVSRKGYGDGWRNEIQPWIENAAKLEDDSAESVFSRELLEPVKAMRLLLVGARIDDGLGLHVVTLFDDEPKAKKVLTALAGDVRGSSVQALPAGKVIAAHAAAGHGEKNMKLARAILNLALKGFAPDVQIISPAHRPNVLGVFGEIWSRLRGSRSAVHRNTDTAKLGDFSAVAVLDTADAPAFLAELKELAAFGSSTGVKLDDGTGEGVDEARVRALIAQMGDDDYRVRESASAKLGLLGEPALPYLEKAAKGDDVEIKARCEFLIARIRAVVADRTREFLQSDLLTRVSPKLIVFPKAERIAGASVDVVKVKIADDKSEYAAALRRVLGPDWDKIRLATVGNQVAVLFGSDKALLEQTIENLRKAAPALAADESLKLFQQRTDAGRNVELHFSLARTAELLAEPAPAADAKAGLSSFALTVRPDSLRGDVFIPFSEIKAMVKLQGWNRQ